MDEDSDNIVNFESILENSKLRKQQIYTDNDSLTHCYKENYKAKDVLSNISKQLNALQRADGMNINKNRLSLRNVVKPALEPVNLLSLDNNPNTHKDMQNDHKFETQDLSDTQLINIVMYAEKMETTKGVTQEFENSFSEHHIERKKNSPNVSPVIASKTKSYVIRNKPEDSLTLDDVPSTSKTFINNEKNTHLDMNNENPDNNTSLRNILNQNESIQLPKNSLICTLDTFENFETLAFPFIEQNPDIDLAKALINSQIIDRELCITIAYDTTSREPSSPILTNKVFPTTNNSDCDKINKVPYKEPDKVTDNQTKLKKSFEEDIFCSDEENVEEENFRELPETCALDFLNNPSDIFDKTLYVGFQTASNKSIQIQTDSFCKAQNILGELNDNNLTIMELVERCDNAKNQSNTAYGVEKDKHVPENDTQYNEDKLDNKLLKTTTSSIEKELNLSSEQTFANNLENDESKPILNTKDIGLVGFKTASSKKINLSDKALARCRQIFQDINLDEIYDPKDESNTSCSPRNDQNNEAEETQVQCDNNKVENELPEVSEQITLIDQTILQEFENDLLTDFEIKDKNEIENSTENLGEHVPNKECSECNNDKLHTQMFVGFKTANNKNIKISEHALTKTKNIFEEFNLLNHVGNDIRINENTEANKYQNLLKETRLNIKPNTSCGFLTASNKSILISTEALKKSKKLFEDIDNVKGEKEMLKNKENSNKYLQNDIHLKGDTNQTKCPTIDYTKLHNAHNGDHKYNQFKIPINKNVEKNDKVNTKGLLKDLLNKSCEAKVNYGIENNQVFKGFQTASNKQVKVSEKSLAASKKLFEDLQINENNNFNVDNQIFYEKQTILTNKDIHGSPQTKFDNVQTDSEKLNNSCKDKPHYNDKKSTNIQHQGFSGFRSASNKVINISEQALAKSKSLFLDLDIDEQNKNNETDCNSPNNLFNDNDEPGKKFNCFNTNNRKNSHHSSNDDNRDIPNSKRIKLSNQNLLDKESHNSDEENNQIPDSKPSVENITSTLNNKARFELLFKTANNNNIKISEEALLKSKRVLTELNQNQIVDSNFSQSTDIINEGSIENIMNTQLLKDFEDNLCTEDFRTDVPKNKRCGSPILSCPRAKKSKRFAVPYNKWEIPKTKPKETNTFEVNTSFKFTFDTGYKKHTKLSMKNIRDIEFNKSVEIDPYILNFNFENTLDFKFGSKRNEISDDIWSTEDLKKYFVNLVNRKIIPDGWLDNHLKLIIFKLISYEKEYKYAFQGICSVKNILNQLKYRYDKELYNVERPVFRKLLEKDDVSTKTMVLRVNAIYVDGVITESIPDASNIELLLTDGWYCIKSSLDQMLTRLVKDRKIRVSTKLVTNGAELLNCEQGIAPWEDTSSVRLKLFGNSTRRARFDAKLGYHGGAAILSRLSRIQLEGGKVSKLRALVTRVYPTLYVEKFEDGSKATRSERLEHLHQMKFESDRQVLLEKIYEEVEKEFIDEESQDSECDMDVRNMESGSQIHRLMKKSIDSSEFVANLTSAQCSTLQKYTDRRRERVLQTLQDRIASRVQKLQLSRNVLPVIKIRVADVTDDGQVSKAMMSIWRPNEAVMDIIKEGTWIEAFNIVPTARRYSEIQLSAGRQTVFSRSNYKVNENVQQIVANLKRNCYSIESLVKMPTKITDYNEIDVVGLIFLIEPTIEEFNTKEQNFQNVYLTDADRNLICVNFWGGLKKFGYENILVTGLVFACMNLQKRTGNSRKGIPQYRATEYSYFTKTSKHANVRIMMDDLNKKISSTNIKQLCENCVAVKNNHSIAKNIENISPYRINYSDYNISKHKAFIDSPLASKPVHVDDILNLTGLDFESSFNRNDTQDVPTEVILRKNKVNEKIAKLKMYGEPPPLKAIHIINKSKNATKEFKSPLASRNDSPNSVASEKLHKSNSAIDCTESTPEMLNKQNKRLNLNPVKLNFCCDPSGNDGDEKIDPFAEEFDCSPPISLD